MHPSRMVPSLGSREGARFSASCWPRQLQSASQVSSNLPSVLRNTQWTLAIPCGKFPCTCFSFFASLLHSRPSSWCGLRPLVSDSTDTRIYQNLDFVRLHVSADGTHKVSDGAFGARYGIYVLCLISLLLLTRQAFFVATANNAAKQNDENWWYPLAAVPELVSVVLFAVPGLVPSRAELPL